MSRKRPIRLSRCWWCRRVTSPPPRRWCGRWTRSTTPGPNSALMPWRTSSVSNRTCWVGQQGVPYIEPQRVQDAVLMRVLLAKSAISTGWDCPRAEVLVSMRPAKDRTHITQLLGRMIRTPLARRIPGNELLNSVDCLLPFFDRKTATGVAEMLMKGATSRTRRTPTPEAVRTPGTVRPGGPAPQPEGAPGGAGDVRSAALGDDPEEGCQADPQAHCAGHGAVEGPPGRGGGGEGAQATARGPGRSGPCSTRRRSPRPGRTCSR